MSGAHRSAQYPDLPTIGEFYPGFENSIWLGLFGPAGMPEAVLSQAARGAQARARVAGRQAEDERRRRARSLPRQPEEFAALIQRDYEKYAKVVKDIGIGGLAQVD